MKNFARLAQGCNTMSLLLEVKRQPELWDQITTRLNFAVSPHRETHDIWLRYKDQAENIASGNFSNFADEHDPIWYPAMDKLPAARALIFNLMALVQGERLGGVLIYKVQPGEQIYPHTDKGWHPEYYDKYNFTLQSTPGAAFVYPEHGESMVSQAGDLYWFKNTVPHGVVNDGDDDHIVMTVCIRSHGGGKER